MTKTKKTIVAVLAIFAVGATAAAGMAMSKSNAHMAFADTASVREATSVAGSVDNPVAAIAGVNTISNMVVGGNAEMGFKELVYYMTFTPANSGSYTFTHSNPDIGVGEISSATDVPYGEWNEDYTVYSIELTAGVEYTILVNNYDWNVDLTNYEVGSEYTLAAPATITIAYASAAAGSSSDNALAYTVGDTILVSAGHDPVWYTYNAASLGKCYLISMSGTATAYISGRGGLTQVATATNGKGDIEKNNTIYLCVTPTATEAAKVQVLLASEQTTGSCIVTAAAIPENKEVGNGTWYMYEATADGTAALTATDNAPTVVTEEETVKLCGTVEVYEGYTLIGTLSDGAYVPATLPAEGETVPTYTNVTLTANKTYYFYAPAYEHVADDGTIVEILSKLVIA